MIDVLHLPAQLKPLKPAIAFPGSNELKDEAAERLAEAVRIPTVSYDDMGPMDEDVSDLCHTTCRSPR